LFTLWAERFAQLLFPLPTFFLEVKGMINSSGKAESNQIRIETREKKMGKSWGEKEKEKHDKS